MKKSRALIFVIALCMSLMTALCACGNNVTEETQQEEKTTYTFNGTSGYTVELPLIYKEKVVIESVENGDNFYLDSMHEDGNGGFLFAILKVSADVAIEYRDYYVFLGSVENDQYYYVAEFASDWIEDEQSEYTSMLEYYNSIADSFSAEGFVAGAIPKYEPSVYDAIAVSYEDLARYPDSYIGKNICVTGEVYDAGHGDYQSTCSMHITKDEYGYWKDSVYVVYETGLLSGRILAGDIITVYGIYEGAEGFSETPEINAYYIEY